MDQERVKLINKMKNHIFKVMKEYVPFLEEINFLRQKARRCLCELSETIRYQQLETEIEMAL